MLTKGSHDDVLIISFIYHWPVVRWSLLQRRWEGHIHQWSMLHRRCKSSKHKTIVELILGQNRRLWTNIKPTLGWCLVIAGGETLTTGHYSTICASPLNTRRIPNVVLMLDQRRRRWSNIKSTLARCILFTVRDTDGCWAADNCAFWRSPFWEAHGDCPPPPSVIVSMYHHKIIFNVGDTVTTSHLVTGYATTFIVSWNLSDWHNYTWSVKVSRKYYKLLSHFCYYYDYDCDDVCIFNNKKYWISSDLLILFWIG